MNLQNSLIELRQYTLHTGQRDTLIELFEREFLTGQEEAGMFLIGQFTDHDRPDCFVWIRAFPNMEKRKQALEQFYFGAIWKAHREAANATMIDSDNVLLLKPMQGFSSATTKTTSDEILVGLIYHTNLESAQTFYAHQLEPILLAAKAEILATYCSQTSENTFPKLPVRTETVFVCFARFTSQSAFEAQRSSLENLPLDKLELLRLRSTRHSRL